jgi:hypothetical protein
MGLCWSDVIGNTDGVPQALRGMGAVPIQLGSLYGCEEDFIEGGAGSIIGCESNLRNSISPRETPSWSTTRQQITRACVDLRFIVTRVGSGCGVRSPYLELKDLQCTIHRVLS